MLLRSTMLLQFSDWGMPIFPIACDRSTDGCSHDFITTINIDPYEIIDAEFETVRESFVKDIFSPIENAKRVSNIQTFYEGVECTVSPTICPTCYIFVD